MHLRPSRQSQRTLPTNAVALKTATNGQAGAKSFVGIKTQISSHHEEIKEGIARTDKWHRSF